MSAECFWMGGRLATGAIEISHEPSALESDGFWAIQVDYEGQWTLIRFAEVLERLPFPDVWQPSSSSWQSTMNKDEYTDYVSRAREAIADGDFYQVNACRIISRESSESLTGLFNTLLENNPAPYAAYFRGDGKEIASASPELFLSITTDIEGVHLKTSPIKGTSTDPAFGEKDQSENVMIVDLMRNDLSRICEDGSVEVPRLLGVEEHPGLFHLVSDVVGKLRQNFKWIDFSSALLPAGSISGAPKSSATAFIEANEGPRGVYCGLLGWVEKSGANINGVLSVAIRTFWREDDRLKFGTGAGITWGSDPVGEWEETELKAKRLIAIADGRLGK
ncbi:MAG: chorismate-binding protein [Actinomycetes bacterium]